MMWTFRLGPRVKKCLLAFGIGHSAENDGTNRDAGKSASKSPTSCECEQAQSADNAVEKEQVARVRLPPNQSDGEGTGKREGRGCWLVGWLRSGAWWEEEGGR